MKPIIKNALWGLLGFLVFGIYMARQEFKEPQKNEVVCMSPDGRRLTDFFVDQQARIEVGGVTSWQGTDKTLNMTNFPCVLKMKLPQS